MPRSTKSLFPTVGGFKSAEGFDNKKGGGGPKGFVQNALTNAISNLSGIISTKPTAKYASGARCVLRINGDIVGFAFAISWRINTMAVEINTIDDYEAYELAPQRVTVEGSISMLHIPGTSAGTQLWQADAFSFLFHKYVGIEVRDSQTDNLLFATAKAVMISRTEEHRVDQLANVTLNWRAIGFLDEKPPEEPEGFNKQAPKINNKKTKKSAISKSSKLTPVEKKIAPGATDLIQQRLNKQKGTILA
jgi:hypothetical protein